MYSTQSTNKKKTHRGGNKKVFCILTSFFSTTLHSSFDDSREDIFFKNAATNNGISLDFRVKIHQPLLSQFSLLAEFLIGKLPVKDYDSRVLTLVNLAPG